jgi:hypothetical protein
VKVARTQAVLWWLGALVTWATPAVYRSQEVPTASLGPPLAVVDSPFLSISAVRELDDGRLLVSDTRDRRVVVVDFARSAVQPVGRIGRGPGEYTLPGPIWPLRGDSSLMMDGTRRWLYLVGPRISGSVPPDAPVLAATNGMVFGADSVGWVLDIAPRRQAATRDSSRLILVERGTGHSQFIAMLRSRPFTLGRTSGGVRAVFGNSLTGEEGLLFPDGWVAIARLDPYRVDWRRRDGAWILGRPLLHENAPGNPPYGPFPLLGSKDGYLFILRNRTSRRPDRWYDVVDRTGQLATTIVVAPNERIVGFGKASVYVERQDSDGFRHLSKHAWPPIALRGRHLNPRLNHSGVQFASTRLPTRRGFQAHASQSVAQRGNALVLERSHSRSRSVAGRPSASGSLPGHCRQVAPVTGAAAP